MTDFEGLLKSLHHGKVDFILIGEAAAVVHGSARLTEDLDLVYSRTSENIKRLASSLRPLSPYYGARRRAFLSCGMPIRRGLNFTLATSLRSLDLFGEITGGGTYEEMLPDCVDITVV